MGTKQGDSAQTVYLYTGLANKYKVHVDYCKGKVQVDYSKKLQYTVHVDYCNKQKSKLTTEKANKIFLFYFLSVT